MVNLIKEVNGPTDEERILRLSLTKIYQEQVSDTWPASKQKQGWGKTDYLIFFNHLLLHKVNCDLYI